eukprot:3823-Pleurochrysis_carterae.AAC.3
MCWPTRGSVLADARVQRACGFACVCVCVRTCASLATHLRAVASPCVCVRRCVRVSWRASTLPFCACPGVRQRVPPCGSCRGRRPACAACRTAARCAGRGRGWTCGSRASGRSPARTDKPTRQHRFGRGSDRRGVLGSSDERAVFKVGWSLPDWSPAGAVFWHGAFWGWDDSSLRGSTSE